MRGNDAISNALRFVLIAFLQVFLFRQVSLGFGGKDYLFIYLIPVFTALLPLRTPRPLVVLFSFVLGISVDLFYETLGVHAAAATFVGYARQFALGLLEPRDGYKAKSSPEGKDLGNRWWMQYLLLMVGGYCVFFFSMEAFSPVYWRDIMVKSLFTIPVSWLFCIILVTFLRPRI